MAALIDPATGMRPGERYRIDNIEREHQFTGFFLDGKYYLGPELLTAVGWLEGRQFVYDSLDAAGEPQFPGRIAGTIEGLQLTLADGSTLGLERIEQWPPQPVADKPRAPHTRSHTWATAALLVIGASAMALLLRRRR